MKKFYFKLSRQSFAVLLGLFCATPLLAQTGKTVTGTVKELQVPLVGVMVKEEGTDNSTFTDANGHYSLTLQQDDAKLIFEQLDFPIREEEVLNRSVINVRFTKDEESIQLKDVVVNAGYYSVKDKERTGSIARVTAKEIENQPVNNVLDALQGRVAGLEITPTSGNSGAGYEVKIRGQNSINAGNDPLYVIDGVPFSTTSLGSFALGGTILPGGNVNPLNTLDPKSIESIEVLKDADATAIYGSRGANGVILITTKKGKSGKTSFSVDASTTMIVQAKFLKLLSTEEYLEMRKEAFANDGITTYPINAYDLNGSWDQSRYTNWQKELLGKTRSNNRFSLMASGGSEHTSYSVGSTMMKEHAVYDGNFNYSKLGIYSTLQHQSPDQRFKLNLSTQYNYDRNFLPASDLTRISYALSPNAPALYTADGELNWANNTWSNPLASLRSTYRNKTTNLNANAVVSYQVLNGVTVKTNIGYQQTDFDEFQANPHTMYNPAYGSTSASSYVLKSDNQQNGWIVEPQLDFTYPFAGGKLNGTIGGTLSEQNRSQLVLMAFGFADDYLMNNIRAANSMFYYNESDAQYKYAAIYGRLNYQLKDRYFFNLTGRRDGSSRFGPKNRFANFGAVGAAWIFSKENFLSDHSWLSFGKIRTSYGVTGNDQIGDYQYIDTYTISQGGYDNTIVLSPTRLLNPNFGWEKNKKFELALELSFFNHRLNAEFAYYRNRSSNQLMNYRLPSTTGFTSVQANMDAIVENKGFELSLNGDIVRNANVKWNSSFLFSLPRNTLRSFDELDKTPYVNQYIIGESVSIKKVYQYEGVDPTTGIFQFKDFNQDGELTADDRKVLVDLSPTMIGNWQNNFQYKQWSVDVLFQYVKKKGYNEYLNYSFAGAMTNMPNGVMDRWQKPGDENKRFQRFTTGNNAEALSAYDKYYSSTAIIEDASYIRLKSMSISYQLPIKSKENVNCLLYLQGQNLWTLSKIKGIDPETERSFLPTPKRISIGARLTF